MEQTVAALTSVGWFTSTKGTALHGTVVTELRVLLEHARDDLDAFGRDLGQDGIGMLQHRAAYRAAHRRWQRLAAALDRVLAKPEPTT